MDSNVDDILKYHRGELSEAEMHALEKKALSDPFLADALEGSGQLSGDEFAKDVSSLRDKIAGRARPVFTPLRIAAAFATLVAAGWLGLSLFDNDREQLALKKEEFPASSMASAGKDSVEASSTTAEERTGKPADQPNKDQQLALRAARVEEKEAAEKKQAAKQDLAARDSNVKAAQPELAESRAEGAVAQRDVLEAPVGQQPTQALTTAGETRKIAAKERSTDDRMITQVSGKVTLAEDGIALPGASVRVKGSSRGTVTDLHGNYSFDAGEEKPTLVFSFIGMQTREASVTTGQSLDVALTEDVSQLSEVVVTGKKIPSDDTLEPVLKLAEPVGGFKAYDKYLYGSLRYPQQAIENNVKGRVTIQFTVDTNGDLNEFTVMKSLGFGCDQEVIRLVKEGPAWNPTTENDVPTESLVRVRVKFDPSKVKR